MRTLKRGDTLVEVVFAIAVFSFVAILSISLMNGGIASAQAALEITMARNEIDAQAEAIRFIHNSFLTEREYSNEELYITDNRQSNVWYAELWRTLTRYAGSSQAGGLANLPNQVAPLSVDSCERAYNGWTSGSNTYRSIKQNHAFVINTRLITPDKVVSGGNDNVIYSIDKHPNKFAQTPLYPRIIFTKSPTATASTTGQTNSSDDLLEQDSLGRTATYRFISRVEGIWVLSVRDARAFDANPNPSADVVNNTPAEYYDFHIRTCWYAPGRDIPTTIGTIIRLYNPEYVEASR